MAEIAKSRIILQGFYWLHMICAFGCFMMLHMSNNFWVVEFLIFFEKNKNCLFVLMDIGSFTIKDYPMILGLAAHDLGL